ncbi:hypothetical protein LCGC14_2745890, partial [marine sediment metagenome]
AHLISSLDAVSSCIRVDCTCRASCGLYICDIRIDLETEMARKQELDRALA